MLFDLLELDGTDIRREPLEVRKVRGRVRLTDGDRLFLIQLYRWFPTILKALTSVMSNTGAALLMPAASPTGNYAPR